MADKFEEFGARILSALPQELQQSSTTNTQSNFLSMTNQQQEQVDLLLTPFADEKHPVTAQNYFAGVDTVDGLISGYHAARNTHPFEEMLFYPDSMSEFAASFVERVIQSSTSLLTDSHAKSIASLISDLDIFAAVKAVESLIYNPADLKLLQLAHENRWMLHFDHLAIRCGSQKDRAAEKVVELMKKEYGYLEAQTESEVYYQFSDGWNAYPLYKMLENGQVIRLFIDQSNTDAPNQIIQHWNYVYGFTAHHLALRASKFENNKRVAVPITEIMTKLKEKNIKTMTPAGMYSKGLLEQVFTEPKREDHLPDEVVSKLVAIDKDLAKVVGNSKLLEIVSRRELPEELKQAFFALYDIKYNYNDSLHSVPIYNYFLPAQAAHVIKTSLNTMG